RQGRGPRDGRNEKRASDEMPGHAHDSEYETPSSYSYARGSALLRPAALRQARLHFQRVLVIELLQDLVGEPHAVQLPERVVAAVVVEVLVVGLEHAPVVGVLGRLVGVLPEHQAVLVLGEELRGGVRLPAELI